MPSDPPPVRVPLRPGADFHERLIPITHQPRRHWFRIHPAATPALLFRTLPHHRFSHPDGLPLLYVGATVQTCLWEVFGGDVFHGGRAISSARWNGYCLSRIGVPALKVCSVTLERTRDSMSVDKASLMAIDLSIPQAWSLAVQRHPATFDAIKYSSRFLDQSCLALFERGDLRSGLKVEGLGALSDLDSAVEWLDERDAALV